MLNIVHVQLKTETVSKDIELLKVNKNINPNVLYFITLNNTGTKVMLTDFGKNKLYLNYTDDEYNNYCKKFGLTYNNGVIEKEYKHIDDIHNFIALLDYLVQNNK